MKNYQRAQQYIEQTVERLEGRKSFESGGDNQSYIVPVDWENIKDGSRLTDAKDKLLPWIRVMTISNSVQQLELGDTGRREELAQGHIEVFVKKDSGTLISNEIIGFFAQGFEADHIQNYQNDIIVRTPYKGLTIHEDSSWYRQSLVVPLLVHSLIVS